MPETNSKPWTFSVPIKLVARLEKRTQRLGMTRSEYVRHLVREDYRKNKNKKNSSK